MSNIIETKLSKILPTVEKPGRYIGGEFNTPALKPSAKFNFCFCFPDIYEIGMSNLGMAILYDIVNKLPLWTAERCYAVKDDMAAAMRAEGIPLFSLETKTPLKDFDIVGFSVQYELLYTNILYMLELAGIPLYAKDRGDAYPILVAGGPCTANPEPFAPFFDIVAIGEGEDETAELCNLFAEAAEKGYTKEELLTRAKRIEGVYVPAYTDTEKETVKKAVVRDFDSVSYPEKPLVPNIEIVHSRVSVELFRGCSAGCRFCQAGFWYRPIREKSAKTVVDCAVSMLENTGFDEVTLSSLSTSDYTHLKDAIKGLSEYTKPRKIGMALPSLRLSSFEQEFADNARKSSLTFAPEAGTQRLRNVINKNITDADIDGIENMFEAGYRNVKLYFMMGLPTETKEDLDGIAEICNRLRGKYIKLKGRKDINISVSCSVFVPKPSTPFQWERQLTISEMLERQAYLRGKLREVRGVTFSWHGAESSRLEAALARGGKELAVVIEEAYKSGCRFDGWTEHFKWDNWVEAFEKCGISMDTYTESQPLDKPLKWDFIDSGVKKEYFVKEREKAILGETTAECRNKCNACGANQYTKCF